MQELEKILEEIEHLEKIQFSSYTKPLITIEDVEKIIRKHMNDKSTDICPKCRKKLYEYEKKYNCVVDIGMNGCDGARGEKYILPHGERRRN